MKEQIKRERVEQSAMSNTEQDVTSRLLTEGQQQVKALLKALPEDTPSLQWRSSLNERLLALEPIKKKVSFLVLGFRALAGFGLASLVCVAIMSRMDRGNSLEQFSNSRGTALASALISVHRDSVASGEIADRGIVEGDSESKGVPAGTNDDSEPDTL